ncbi:MAG: acyl--CoA ligase [Clostridia bacterium]|nr:acyl--CoA ligase [Clostridia bacterium]
MNKKRVLYEAKEYRDIRELVWDTVRRYPDNVAFIIKEQQDTLTYRNITYQMLQQDIKKLGTALIELGLEGKRIAIIANNRYEWCLSYLATLCGVGIVVPLDKSLPLGEIEGLLQRSYADAVVFEEKYSETMQSIKQNAKNNIEHYICMDSNNKKGFLSLEDLLKKGEELLLKRRYSF